MQEPDYVLKFDESTLITEQSGVWSVIQKVCFAVIAIIVVGSLVFKKNLLGEMSGTCVGMLLSLLLLSFFRQKHVWKPTEIELRFYPDKLIIYRDKRVYSTRMARREWIEMRYADVWRFVLRTSSKRLSFSSKLHGIYWKYNKDGTLPEKPYYDKVTDSGNTINLHFIGDMDIVKEIETHSPLKVTLEDS